MTEVKPPLASESCHYYDREGNPKYTVIGKNGNERPTTIKDVREHGYVPSVSTILQTIAKPGLNVWREEQLLYAALTLPRSDGETLTEFSKRVREDAKAQAIAAAERGTQLHASIERYIRGVMDTEWQEHLEKLDATLQQHGIDLKAGKPEHSFATQINQLGFGGKIDFWIKNEPLIADFKSKEKIEDGKRLAWDEHKYQLSAYSYALFSIISSGKRAWKWQPFRALNIFIGVSDCEIRVVEHPMDELEHSFSIFQDILSVWYKKHRLGKYANGNLR